MIYNNEFTKILQNEFASMSVSNPPAIDPKAMGIAVSLLRNDKGIADDALICIGVITHQFIQYCHKNKIVSNYQDAKRLLESSLAESFSVSCNDPGKITSSVMNSVYMEFLMEGSYPMEITYNINKCLSIAQQYCEWYINEAVKAGCITAN